MNMERPALITLLGPTAVGKTKLAAALAVEIGAEIISADSRQVFRRMDIGSGKDLADYEWNGKAVKYHLVDVAEPGEEFSVFRFRNEFNNAYQDIISRKNMPLMCGGTGLYLESVLRDYDLRVVPSDDDFRKEAENCSMESLAEELWLIQPLHNTTDIGDRGRLIRALEIARFRNQNPFKPTDKRNDIILGLRFGRAEIRKRITIRLHERLKNGMIEEVEGLLKIGIPAERLLFYGLEYKYVTQFLTGQLPFDEMANSLETAIHQFAKRQMTWFRRMERNGIRIFWLEGEDGFNNNLGKAVEFVKRYNFLNNC